MTGSDSIDAERAFARTIRARRRAAMARVLRRRPGGGDRLAVYDARDLARSGGDHGRREIPICAIRGTCLLYTSDAADEL